MAATSKGDLVLDPFMGSGTTLVEARLTGLSAIGFDISPLAHLIASAKVSGLDAGADHLQKQTVKFEKILRRTCMSVGIHWDGTGAIEKIDGRPLSARDFAVACGSREAEKELDSWFPRAVQHKLIAVLRSISLLTDSVTRSFIRVCLSDLIRGVSQQEPRDLRIRRRAYPIEDAPVIGALLYKVWREIDKVRMGKAMLQPGLHQRPIYAECVDVRTVAMGRHRLLRRRKADAVVSSPPYATALPYVDTDRLSFLVLGLASPRRRNMLQRELIGTREIADRRRRYLEDEMESSEGLATFPGALARDLGKALRTNRAYDVGFRRRNTPALLYQYFRDMRAAMRNVREASRLGALVFLVLGDSETTLGSGECFRIRTCEHVASLCEQVGFHLKETIDITVTTEDLAHSKNAITENQILVLQVR
jgi:hypothetical protein